MRKKYCWMVGSGWFVQKEKYCCLVADKPNEQASCRRAALLPRDDKAGKKEQTNRLAVGGQLCFHEMIRQEKRNSRKEKI
jgi:hypothetical protein